MRRALPFAGGAAAAAGATAFALAAFAGPPAACAAPVAAVDARIECPEDDDAASEATPEALAVAPPGADDGAALRSAAPCTATAPLLRAVGVSAGRSVRVRFTKRSSATVVRVSVFQSAVSGAVVGERLVFRRTARSGLSWSGARQGGRPALRDGVLFVRIAARRGSRTDTRRFALRHSGGRFSEQPTFARRDGCGAVRSFKLERPALGGRRNRAVSVSFRLADERPAIVELRRGGRTVRRLSSAVRGATVLHRVRIGAEGLPRGRYEVRLRAGGAVSSVYLWRV